KPRSRAEDLWISQPTQSKTIFVIVFGSEVVLRSLVATEKRESSSQPRCTRSFGFSGVCSPQEAAGGQPLFGGGISGCGERIVPTALRYLVGAGTDRISRSRVSEKCRADHHRDGVASLQGTDFDEEGPSGPSQRGRLDPGL